MSDAPKSGNWAFRYALISLFRKYAFRKNLYTCRESIANLYIRKRKKGIEIGAAQHPTSLSKKIEVQYIDKHTKDEYEKKLGALGLFESDDPGHFVNVDIIDEAGLLEKIEDCSQNFVIANHVLEHCEDPIEAVGNMLRALKNDGILFLSIPDKRYTFDAPRETTTIEHLVSDNKEGPACSRRAHLEDYVQYVDNISDPITRGERIETFDKHNHSIHYHVWSQFEMFEFFITLKRQFNLNFEIEHFCKNELEAIFVLRKTTIGGAGI